MITRIVELLSRIPLRFPRTVLVVSLLLTLVCAAFIPRLHVSTDRNLLSGTDNPIFQRRDEVNNMFGTALVAAVIVRGNEDRAELKRAVTDVAARLATHKDQIRDVFFRADIESFERHGMLFLPESVVEKIVAELNIREEELTRLVEIEDLPALVTGLAEYLSEMPATEDASKEEVVQGIDGIRKVISELGSWFADDQKEQLSIAGELWDEAPLMLRQFAENGYLTDNDRATPPLGLIMVQPTSSSQAMEVVAPLTDLIRRETKAALEAYPGMTAVATGMPPLVTDEMRLVTVDCMMSGIVAAIGVLLVFMLAFRSIRVGLFLVLPLGVGLVWTAGLVGFLYGYLTLITAYFAAVLFGLGVAFTIHIVARFHEAIREDMAIEDAVRWALIKSGPGVVVGGATTALAFLAIVFSDFKGFAEMGVISGAGITLILIANLTLLPAALVLWHPGKKILPQKSFVKVPGVFWIQLAKSRLVVPVTALLLAIAGLLVLPMIDFDYAVESMLPDSAEAVEGINLINARTDFTTTYAVSVASSLEEAEKLRLAFEEKSTVSRAEALSMFVPSRQQEKIALVAQANENVRNLIGTYFSRLDNLQDKRSKLTAAALAESMQTLGDTFEDLAFDARRAGRFEAKHLSRLARATRQTEKQIVASKNDERAQALEQVVMEGMYRAVRVLNSAFDETGFGTADLPQTVLSRYLSADQKNYAVLVYSSGDIAEKEFFIRHFADLVSVDENVTGHPVTHYHFTNMVHDGFTNAVLLAAIAVIILILLDIRSIIGLTLALLPVVFAACWTALVMVLFDFKLNYANLMGLPILIGTGVDYGVHLAHRARQEGSTLKAAKTTGRAIALSGLTTLIGFGSLLIGDHWGVQSLGLLLVIGILSALVVTLVVLPGIFQDKDNSTPMEV